MIFVFDCDDVLLDWIGGFRAFLADRGIHPATPEPATWDMDDWVGQKALPLVREFNSSVMFSRLTPLPGAVEALRKIRDRGHEINVLSSCEVEGAPVNTWRHHNLLGHFGPDMFKSIICTPLGTAKSNMLHFLMGDVWIEDNYRHAMAGKVIGYNTWMVRRPHNRVYEGREDGVNWIDSVADLVSHYA